MLTRAGGLQRGCYADKCTETTGTWRYPVKRGTTGICTVAAAIASTVRGSVST
jgi:hypothetical protein